MAEQFIWGALQRALNDPTTIDEAIAASVAAHNNEAESHLGTEQSLEMHRENPVVDHPAESVVNDKLEVQARRYVAIVDPLNENSFDTIQGAITYAEENGYGDIYVARGVHYITGDVDVDSRISLYGAGPDETYIRSSSTTDANFRFVYGAGPTNGSGATQDMQGFTFGGTNARIGFKSSTTYSGVTFEECNFTQMGELLEFDYNSPGRGKNFIACRFTLRSTNGEFLGNYCYFENCTFIISGRTTPFLDVAASSFVRCLFSEGSFANTYDFFVAIRGQCIIDACYFQGCYFTTANWSNSIWLGLLTIRQCVFTFFNNNRVRISGVGVRFIGNYCVHAGGQSPLVVSGSQRCVLMANASSAAISNSGTGTQLIGNTTI